MKTVVVYTELGFDEYPGADFFTDGAGALQVKGGGYKATYPTGFWMSVKGKEESKPSIFNPGDKVKASCRGLNAAPATIVHVDGDVAWLTYGPGRNGHALVSTLTRA